MSVIILLIRHAAHDRLGHLLCGRMAHVGLSATGHAQAAGLPARLGKPPGIVYASPLQRTRETASYLSSDVLIGDAFVEIDFGAWSGQSFDELATDPSWQAWNERRSEARPPGGETMQEVQARVMTEVDTLATRHTGEDVRIAIVSHGDVIKAALMAVLVMPLDGWDRFEIAPASISRLVIEGGKRRVISMNETPPA